MPLKRKSLKCAYCLLTFLLWSGLVMAWNQGSLGIKCSNILKNKKRQYIFSCTINTQPVSLNVAYIAYWQGGLDLCRGW